MRHFGRIGSILRTCKGARGDRVGPLQIHVRYRPPSCRRHRWLQTQPPDNSLHLVVNALMGLHEGGTEDESRAVEVTAVEVAGANPLVAKLCKSKARMCASSGK